MAGLCAAARARELGASTVVLEKGTRPGGSMLLSSCVVWRHRRWDDFRAECPGGAPELQREVFERLDEGLAWLESLGAPVVRRETGNPLTAGCRFEPRGLTEALVRAAADVRLQETSTGVDGPLVLATGGFQGDGTLVAEHIEPAGPLILRGNPWSTGDGLRLGLARGSDLSEGLREFYGRNMPDAAVPEERYVSAAQLYARHAVVVNERGEEFLERPVSWSETEVVQATARQPGASAWYLLTEQALGECIRGRSVRDLVAEAEVCGGTVIPPQELPFPLPGELGKKGSDPITRAVRVRAAITHTIGGLRIDERARVLQPDRSPVEGLYACGADAGGIAAGGYASGLASALVFGRIAAETAVGSA